ncbi:hypothetical protein BASA81_003265 [Batrachochytrium salamandrivorans]|nr:hypothetical protein BASA81_003265 [Batrachochytrium salamandrivorans]
MESATSRSSSSDGLSFDVEAAQPVRPPDMFNQALKIPSEFRTFTSPLTLNPEGDEKDDEDDNSIQVNLPPSPRKHSMFMLRQRISCKALLWMSLVAAGITLLVLAVLMKTNVMSSVSEQWFGLAASLVLAYPFARMVLALIRFGLWLAPTKTGTLIAYYYLTICSLEIQSVLTTTVWVSSWYLLILNSSDNASSYLYATQIMWWLFISALLFCSSALAKAFSALYFERTTYWFRVKEQAKREYLLFKLCPKSPLPHPTIMHLHAVGEEATKADPLVLRKLTSYIKRKHLVAHCSVPFTTSSTTSNTSDLDLIDLSTCEDMQDLGQVLFNHFYSGFENVLGEIVHSEVSNTRARLASLKALRNQGQASALSPHGRAIFSPFNTVATVPLDTTTTTPPLLRSMSKGSSSLLSFKLPPKRHPVMKRIIVRNNSLIQTHFEKRYGELFPEEGKDEATRVWHAVFDPMKQGTVSLKTVRAMFSGFHTERVGLGDTLKDSQAAIRRLGSVCDCVALVLCLVALALLLSTSNSNNVWVGLTSFFVTLAVMFGPSAAQIVQNLVFMFFRHPYDVGDLLMYEGSYYSVRKIELLSTTLIRWNGEYSQIPNDKLAQIAICNLSRSGLHWELVEAFVDVATCTEQFVHQLSEYMRQTAVGRPESYSGKVQIICKAFGRPLLLKIQAYVEFSYCPTDLTRLFEDIGRVNQSFADALRRNSATESGVGAGAIRADGQNKQVSFLVPAAGLVLTSQTMALAAGL